jgi:hypothetical protein
MAHPFMTKFGRGAFTTSRYRAPTFIRRLILDMHEASTRCEQGVDEA